METKEIELKLTVAEVNGVLQALGQMPFVQVSTLIQKIQQQAAPQVQAPAVRPRLPRATQVTQYTATNVTTIIDKFTATNFSFFPVLLNVNLVTAGDTAGNQNLITQTKDAGGQ
jgi:hypothetical protein